MRQCLRGYQTLVEVEPGRRMSRMSWAAVAITDSHLPEKDRAVLTLKFDDAPETMTQRMNWILPLRSGSVRKRFTRK